MCLRDPEPDAERPILFELGNRDGDGEQAHDGGKSLLACLGPVAARIDADRSLQDGVYLLGPAPTRFRQQCSKWPGAGDLAWLTSERPGAHALGPGVQGRVGRCPPVPVEQAPGHIAQTPVALRVGHALELDKAQSVRLVRQDVARQEPEPALA